MLRRSNVIKALVAATIAALAAPAIAVVSVTGAWVRGTVEGQETSGAYMVINSDRDVTLVGVQSDVATDAMLHEMKMHDNMMMMMPVERLPVAAGRALILDEHNYHIMLEGLKHQIKPGQNVSLRLKFVDAKGAIEEVQVTAVARELSAHEDPSGHGSHMHDGAGHE
jgi:copper(I)-binding protein